MKDNQMRDIFLKLRGRSVQRTQEGLSEAAEEAVEEAEEFDARGWLEENSDEELEELLDDLGMTQEDMEEHLNEIKAKGRARKKPSARRGGSSKGGGPKGDSKKKGVKFKGKVPGKGGKFNFKKCVASKVADRKFKVKNTKKYPTKEAAARALCSWIISRSRRGDTQGKMRGSRGAGRGYSGKSFKGWAPGSGKGGKPLKFSPAQLRKMKKAKQTASVDEPIHPALSLLQSVLEYSSPGCLEEILTAVDLYLEGETDLENLRLYVLPRIQEEDQWEDLQGFLQDFEELDDDDLDPTPYLDDSEEAGDSEEGENDGSEE